MAKRVSVKQGQDRDQFRRTIFLMPGERVTVVAVRRFFDERNAGVRRRKVR